MSKDKSRSRTYQVGYGKPPAATRFKEGKSGNPSGKRKMRQVAPSEFDVAMRALTRPVTARIGEKTERMSALDAIHRKRAELALKGVAWAVRACCEDAKAYGLASDSRNQIFMRVSLVEGTLTKDALNKMSDEQLRGLLYLLETHTVAKAQQKKPEDPFEAMSGFYMVAIGTNPNFTIKHPKTAREAHEIATSAKMASQEIRIFDTRGIEITEAGLARLAEREIAKD